MEDFEEEEKPRYIALIDKLTNHYEKTFSEIKYEPDLA